jgi:hypothetical protein
MWISRETLLRALRSSRRSVPLCHILLHHHAACGTRYEKTTPFFKSGDYSSPSESNTAQGCSIFPSMKALQTASAVIELGAGLALLCFPSIVVELLVGAPLEAPAALTVARVGGAGLFALGVGCWIARSDAQSRAAKGLVAALLLYDVAAVVILVSADIGFGLRGIGLWPAVVLHAVMTVWCVIDLLRNPITARSDGPLATTSKD